MSLDNEKEDEISSQDVINNFNNFKDIMNALKEKFYISKTFTERFKLLFNHILLEEPWKNSMPVNGWLKK